MMRRLLLLVGASLMILPALAATIKGRVIDSQGEILPGASAQLVLMSDTTKRQMLVVNTNGTFTFTKKAVGRYKLTVSMLGMETSTQEIQIKSANEVKNLGDIVLKDEATMLAEATVTAVKAAVTAKQDTLEYNAGSYRTQTNATVEDLLKKMDGMEVSSDGSITAGGKSVSKIFVNGKEFFGDDPQAATKNLSADMIDKVQVVEKKSDLAQLTGVDDGEEETIINLTIKKSMTGGWMGSVSGGYGTDGRYEGRFMVNTFNDAGQLSIVGGLNNVNNMGFGDGGSGGFMRWGGMGGINNSQRFGVNFSVGRTEAFRIGGDVFYAHTDRKVITETQTLRLYPNARNTITDANSASRDQGHNISGRFRLQWKLDSANTIDFRPNFAYRTRKSMSDEFSHLTYEDDGSSINSSTDQRRNHGNSWNFNGNFIFNHNVLSHPGRSLSANVRYSFSNNHQYTTTWSDIKYFQTDEDYDELLYRFVDNRQWTNSINTRITWTEPLGDVKRGNFLTFAYHLRMNFNNGDKNSYDVPEPADLENFELPEFNVVPLGAEFNPDLSNQFRNRFIQQTLRVGYKKVNAKYNLETGLEFSPSLSKSTDLINDARSIPTRTVWNVAPFLRFQYRFSKTSSLRINYNANTSSPSMSQLQPVPDVSDPLNIQVGNPDLKPTFTQRINVNFNNFDMETKRFMAAMFNASYALNSIVSKTIFDPITGGRTSTYANANGSLNLWGMYMMNQPLRNKIFRISASMSANYNSYPGYVNGEFNRSGNLQLRPSVGLTISANEIFQFTVRPAYRFQLSTNSLPDQANRTVHRYGVQSDLGLFLPFGLEITTDIDFTKTAGYGAGFNTNQWLWNAQIAYNTLKDKSLTFYVRAYDLLGQNKSISRSVSSSTITDSRVNALTRYVMFGVSWKFNTMKGKQPQGMMGRGMGGSMGRGRGRF